MKKRHEKYCRLSHSLADEITFCQPNQPRACTFDTLFSLVDSSFDGKVDKGLDSRTEDYIKNLKSRPDTPRYWLNSTYLVNFWKLRKKGKISFREVVFRILFSIRLPNM